MRIIDAALAMGSNGELVALAQRDGVRIWRLGETSEPGRLVEGAVHVSSAWDAVTVVGDETWLLRNGSLVRVNADGTARPPQALDLPPGQEWRFSAVGAQLEAVALIGPEARTLSLDCGELVVERLDTSPAPCAVASLGGRQWLLVIERRIATVRAGGLRDLQGAAELVASSCVVDAHGLAGDMAALVVRNGAEQAIWVIDTRTGEVKHRIAIAAPDGVVRFAARRMCAVVVAEHTLELLDLRFGRRLGLVRDPARLYDAAVDAAGQRVAVLRQGSEGVEVGWLPMYELLERGETPAPLWSPPRPAPAPVPAAAPPPAPSDLPELLDAPEPTPGPALPSLELLALAPRRLPEVTRGAPALRLLEHHLALVGGWAKRAVCEGWDSGRLAFATPGALPYEHEVAALIDGARGRADDKLTEARAQALAMEQIHDRELDVSVAGLSPLAAIAREYRLSPLACDLLLCVAAPSIWGAMARLYAIIANDAERPLCDEWLLSALLGERAGRRALAQELDPGAPLLRHGLLRASGGRPFAALTAHPLVIERLYGEDFATDAGEPAIRPHDADRSLDELRTAADLPALLAQLARPTRNPLRLVVTGVTGSGRTTLLAALSARAGRRLGLIDMATLAREDQPLDQALRGALQRTVLRGWLPCISDPDQVSGADPAGVNRLRAVVRGHEGPLCLRAGRGASLPVEPGHVAVELSVLSEGARVGVWRDALAQRGLDANAAGDLAARYLVGPGVVKQVVEEVQGHVGDDPRPVLEAALRQHRDGRMGEIATRVTRLATWSQIVLAPDVIDSVRELVGRVRHRRTVYERWGMDRVMTSSRGLTALFSGGPGTGKTMVAGIIARELGCDLYRVDLSRVMSKWIGETERNLAAVFDAAEDGQAILLFDEADSLFARRTEVKSSNDRFANLEVNYLLQRLDSFEGIAILTTNLAGSIDPAFKRRLSLRLTFPFPDEDARLELWRAHLPFELPVAGDLDLGSLARRYPLSGGYIRNITLRAAFLAAHEHRRLTMEHLERAVALEYREMGKLTAGGPLE